jgi:hypothetical protein
MELVGWKHLSGGYGNAGMRPERRLSGRNRSGRRRPFPSFLDSGEKAINPRGLGTESPFQKTLFLLFGLGSGNHRSVRHSWMSHFTPRRTAFND